MITVTNAEELANSGLVSQLRMMIRALWAAPVRSALLLLAAALCVVVAATAYGQIRLNSWNQPFYDALSRRDFAQFLVQLGVFGLFAGALLVLNVAQRWLGEVTGDPGKISIDDLDIASAEGCTVLAPPWVLIDEVLDSLDEDTRRRIVGILAQDLPHAGVIHIGRADARERFFPRILHLVNDPAGRRLPGGAEPLAVN